MNILISGSKEELDDLRNVYTEYEGDMDDIMDNMMCSTMEDESRYRQVFWGGGEPFVGGGGGGGSRAVKNSKRVKGQNINNWNQSQWICPRLRLV